MENKESKPEILLKKAPCTQYYLDVPGQSWGTFTISEHGDFFIHSDWGYWAFNWRSFGENFKKFLVTLNAEYLLDKIETNQFQFYGIKQKIHARKREAITVLFNEFQKVLKDEILKP